MTQATTRADYDTWAVEYTERFRTALDDMPLDRAMLGAFAELVKGPVGDLGCGPGRLTGHLHALGLDVFGIDLSPAMVALAREEHPGLHFAEGTITALDLADEALGGILAWYSVIHTPPPEVPAVFAEFHRVLAPGGHLLLGFTATDGPSPELFPHKVTPGYLWRPEMLVGLLREAGLVEVARLVRPPTESERYLQGCILARKP